MTLPALGPKQMRALARLARAPLTVEELARLEGWIPHEAARVLATLERRGDAIRSPHGMYARAAEKERARV